MAAATSAATASSTSVATRTASPRRSPRSNTIRTAPRASRCCNYADGEKRYILCPDKLEVGETIISGERSRSRASATPCRCATSRRASPVHAIEMIPGSGAKIARSAGTVVQIAAKEGEYAHLIMPSGEMRRIHLELPRDDRPGRQPGAPEHPPRQGRPHALARPQAAQPRHRHEPD